MCRTILVVVDGTSSDRPMVERVKSLAKSLQSRVILLHIENWQPYGRTKEIRYPGASGAADYLTDMQIEFQMAGVPAEMVSALGEPAAEIKKRVLEKACDVVVMKRIAGRSISEIFFGAIFEQVQRIIDVPILLFKFRREPRPYIWR